MDDIAIRPAAIIVMADDLHMYAWSNTGDCLGHSGLRMIAQYFSEYSCVSELVDLEYEFWDWATTRPRERFGMQERWREFHLEGLILARRLAGLMRPLKIPVFYRSHAGSTHESLEIGPL